MPLTTLNNYQNSEQCNSFNEDHRDFQYLFPYLETGLKHW